MQIGRFGLDRGRPRLLMKAGQDRVGIAPIRRNVGRAGDAMRDSSAGQGTQRRLSAPSADE
jgi:hypothetical protein